MVNQSTINKLIEMRLTPMADAFRQQCSKQDFDGLSFEERFGMLVDAEYNNRKDNKLHRLIKDASFDQPDASIEDIDYKSGRKLNKNLIYQLADCGYIPEHMNIFIPGAMGSGKSYLACALGLATCRQYYTVKYASFPNLLIALKTARDSQCYDKVLKQYSKPTVLIIDEWLQYQPSFEEQKDLLALLQKKVRKTSTIFCSQIEKKEWIDHLSAQDSTLSEAILDRIIYDGYEISIEYTDPEKAKSMREVHRIKRSIKE